MRNDVAQPIVRTLLARIEDGQPWRTAESATPAANYADPAHLAAERASMFATAPQLVALSADLPETGSMLTRDKLGLPVVLTRDEAGQVHALANVCAHRGAQVVPDGTHCHRRLSCGYHGWSYGLDGTHVGLPDAGSFPSISVPRPGLRSLPVGEQHGLIWIVPDLEADGSVDPELGPIADDFDSFGLVDHLHWRRHRFELALNWKLVIDTFLEGYHFATLHRDTVGPLFFSNLGFGERFGRHVREVLPRRTLAELATQAPESWDLVPHSALVYALFPNTVLVMQIDHVETWRVYPDPVDPGRSICDLDFYIPELPTTPSAERHWERNWRLTIDTVVQEDFMAMAGVQRGLASGAIDHMTIGANEPVLSMVHEVWAEAMAGGAG